MNSLIGVFPLGNELNERNERNDEPVTYATASRIDEGGEIVAASLHRRAGKNPLEANLWGGSVEGDRNERTSPSTDLMGASPHARAKRDTPICGREKRLTLPTEFLYAAFPR